MSERVPFTPGCSCVGIAWCHEHERCFKGYRRDAFTYDVPRTYTQAELDAAVRAADRLAEAVKAFDAALETPGASLSAYRLNLLYALADYREVRDDD